MVSVRTLIFHMCIPCRKTFSLVLRSRSSSKVEVIFEKKKKKREKIKMPIEWTFNCFFKCRGKKCGTCFSGLHFQPLQKFMFILAMKEASKGSQA